MRWLSWLFGPNEIEIPSPEPYRRLLCSSCGERFELGVDAGLIADEQVDEALGDVGIRLPRSRGERQPELAQHTPLDEDLKDQTEVALLIVAGRLARRKKCLWTCGECRAVNAYPGHEKHLKGGARPDMTRTLVAQDITDSEKQFELGLRYQSGADVPQDPAAANEWFRKAAQQGHAQAQFSLATNLHGGVGAEKDLAEAYKWYLAAAEQGIARAQCTVAIIINEGEVVPRDTHHVIRWLRKASVQGDGSASFNLAVMYYNGDGVPEDEREAIRLFRKAAAAGYEKAAEVLRQLQ